MSRRRLSWLIGGAVAALALVVVLTAVPLRSEPLQTQGVDVHATTSSADAPACATMRLDGSLESQRTVPLVDLFGLSSVSVALVAPSVKVGGEAQCPPDVAISEGIAIVYTPQCDNPAWVDSEEVIEDYSEPQARCAGNGIYLAATGIDPALNEMTAHNSMSQFELGKSGVLAADTWCLTSEFWVGYSTGNTATDVELDQIEGDLCIDLSS